MDDEQSAAERDKEQSKQEGLERGDESTPPPPGGGKPKEGEQEDA